jgi:hypothetical protein
VGYDGWLTLDLVPTREDVVAACAQSIRALDVYKELVRRIDRAALRQVQQEMDAVEAQRLIHETLLKA